MARSALQSCVAPTFGSRISGIIFPGTSFGYCVSGFGVIVYPGPPPAAPASEAGSSSLVPGFEFRVSGLESRVSGLEF